MTKIMLSKKQNGTGSVEQHEVIIIGGGVCGIYAVHKMLEAGVDATVLEAGDDLGGTWYFNRYPGARFDSESYSYGYSFNKEILDEWDWSEHFAAQPETLRYLNFVADKLNVRPHMQFGCKVRSAVFNEADNTWAVYLENGRELRCNILLTALGGLSAPTSPRYAGMDSFEGPSFHTFYWPKEPVDLAGKKVAVIGTGPTGIQVISEIADKVEELKVFQRRPNWCAPLHNAPINAEEMAQIRSRYDEIFAKMKTTPGQFIHGPDARSYFEVTEEERLELWEELYASPGFGVWMGNFYDVMIKPEAHKAYSAFIADKIRSRVNDPAVAEKLIPKDHLFGVRRIPLETRYYEVYNRDNVSLVDLNETPIEEVTPRGIRTSEGEHEFDIIVYATGFDAITGGFDRIEFVGKGGQKLADKWKDGPVTYMGIQTTGFPNLVFLSGPQSGSAASNFPPGIQMSVDWATGLIKHFREKGCSCVEAAQSAENGWMADLKKTFEAAKISDSSWFTGYNSNVDGHDDRSKLRLTMYLKGVPAYREHLKEVADNGYEGFSFK